MVALDIPGRISEMVAQYIKDKDKIALHLSRKINKISYHSQWKEVKTKEKAHLLAKYVKRSPLSSGLNKILEIVSAIVLLPPSGLKAIFVISYSAPWNSLVQERGERKQDVIQ